MKREKERKAMYEIILFDLDGTLTDPKEGITKSVKYALDYYGIDEPDLEKLTCFIGPPLQESFKVYYGFDEKGSKEAIEKYRERFGTIGLFENRVFKGVRELLETLKNKHKVMAIATSKPQVYAKQILEKYNLACYFDTIVGSELDGTRVVKSEVIEEVFKQLDIKQEDKKKCVMVGDREHDIIGAQRCGIDSIGVTFGYAKPGELESAGATYVVETITALGKRLESEF